jgi:hypothetical protein
MLEKQVPPPAIPRIHRGGKLPFRTVQVTPIGKPANLIFGTSPVDAD